MALRPVLLTDLYQLTMAQGYFEHGLQDTAVFELFVRRLPPERRFLVAAGLEQALEFLESVRFTREEIAWLDAQGGFPPAFLDHLASLRFTGDVHALPEGTPFFAGEPLLRITAPIAEAQLVESRLINILHFQTLIASKAIRCRCAAGERSLTDFGMRRAHEADAALLAARATFLAGFQATATVEAGRRFGIPLSGTLAHSYIEAHASEREAFENFVASRGPGVTLLIDTYDTRRAAHTVTELVARHGGRGSAPVSAVRIDSGELGVEARAVRSILDAGGCRDVRIILSGGLDEQAIARLVQDGTPVDGFGVGTAIDASADAPTLDMAYKLQEYAGRPRRKRSPGKETWPGAKQVWRRIDAQGRYAGDSITLAQETAAGEALLEPVMRGGRRVAASAPLAQLREHCASCLRELPPELLRLEPATPACAYPVTLSAALLQLAAAADGVP